MDQELFNPQSSSVTSSRILYTPSTFARTSLLHLQEVGSLQAIHQQKYSGVRPHKEKINISKEIINKTRGAVGSLRCSNLHTPLRGEQQATVL